MRRYSGKGRGLLMKNRDLIKKLLNYNLDAEINVIAHCKKHDFTITWGSAEGMTKGNAEDVSFYVDELCNDENTN
jgi:hypothetical protein